MAFLDEVRAKDYSIYHGLSDTQVVVLAEAGAAKASSTASVTNEAPNMAFKTKTHRIKKQAEPKVDQLRSKEGGFLAQQVSEATQKHAEIEPMPAKPPTRLKAATPEPRTIVQANINVGFGNALFIRGEGSGLSWDEGQPLTCIDKTCWHWSGTQTQDKVVFKLLLNDKTWAKGENVEVEPGKTMKVVPEF